MTSKELFSKILSDLTSDPYLSEFKYTKSTKLFTIQEGNLRKSIEMDHWADFEELTIRPIYGVKFKVINDWFKDFNVLSKADQRANSDFIFGKIDGLTRVFMNKYIFRKDCGNYEQTIDLLRTDLVNCSRWVFENYGTMAKVFNNYVIPILDGRRKLGVCDDGANWIFRYLKLCRLVSPENYERLKEILMAHFEFMRDRGEPNILKYVDKIDDILRSLESD